MSRLAARTRTALPLALAVGLLAGVAAAQQPEPGPVTESPAGPQPAAAPPAGADKYKIEKGLAMFAKIRDDADFRWLRTGPQDWADLGDDQMEERAYDEVIRHASQFTAAELEAHARRDVLLKDLHAAGRRDYKLDLVYFEGWLRTLRKAPTTDLLRESGITDLYEAWLFPTGTDTPVCVYVTQLPPGLEPPADAKAMLNRYVGIAGYYFKLLRYESRERDKSRVGEKVYRRAAVLMGRSLTPLDEPASNAAVWRETFLPLVVGGVALMAFAILGLSWYFRRGDAIVRREVENKLNTNPFDNA